MPDDDLVYWSISYDEFPDTCTQCASKELIERNQKSIEDHGEEIDTDNVLISYQANPKYKR